MHLARTRNLPIRLAIATAGMATVRLHGWNKMSYVRIRTSTPVALGATKTSLLAAIFLLTCTLSIGRASGQTLSSDCGALRIEGRFGPFDYRADHFLPGGSARTHEALLNIVEHAHFTPEVEAGIRGKSTHLIAADVTYTLHAFPNHHRALLTMSSLAIRQNNSVPAGSPYTIACWFQRAIAWRSDDMIVRLLYASHLTKTKRLEEAIAQAAIVAANAGDNAFTHLNVGLVFFDMGNHELALKHAQKAIELGLNNMALKDLLLKAGKWADPRPSSQQGTQQEKP